MITVRKVSCKNVRNVNAYGEKEKGKSVFARDYDAPCVSKLFTNPFSYLVPTHVLYLGLVLVLPTMTSISVFHRG